MADPRDEFYVGYLDRAPRGIARTVRWTVVGLLALGALLAVLLVVAQAPFDPGVFEFGVERTFDGVVIERPYPLLLVSDDPAANAATPHYLVAFGKHGAGPLVEGLDGQPVRVTGSAIHNERARMIEVHAVEPLEGAEAERLRRGQHGARIELGEMTLVGEIVDSKCHLGVMKPGRGKPHKACAIRCISGGIPPLLRVADDAGRVDYLLLVSSDGRTVNQEILDRIAEPVEITGRVVRSGSLLVLYADPATYRRPDA